MSLRVIGGEYRGRALHSLKGKDTRPTPSMAREALFNMLAPEIGGVILLTSFPVQELVGIEAISRGAQRVTFIEKSPKAAAIIKKNLEFLDNPRLYRLIVADVFEYGDLSRENFVFCSPPFGIMGEMVRLGHLLAGRMDKDALWILQHPKSYDTKEIEELWEVLDKRVYGSNAISYLRCKEK